jgi:serine/threonine protein kinase
MNKYKFQKYNQKLLNLKGGLLCNPGINVDTISQMRSKIEYIGSPEIGFIKENENNTATILFEKDGRGRNIILGKGGMGEVFKGRAIINSSEGTNNIEVAIKIMNNLDERQQNFLCAELLTLHEIQHKNIVKYLGYAENSNIFFIFMEYLHGEEMFNYIVRNIGSMGEKISIMNQLLNGLYYLHQHGIYHRDIKPENIFIIRDEYYDVIVKYIDFGFSCKLDITCQYSKHSQGSPMYLSPEFAIHVKNKTEDKSLYPFYDMWALGHSLYALFVGGLLYDTNNIHKILHFLRTLTQDVIDDKIQRNLSRVPERVRNIIEKLLKVNYLERRLDLLDDPTPTETSIIAPTATSIAAPTATSIAAPTATSIAAPTATSIAAPTEAPIAAPIATPIRPSIVVPISPSWDII